MIKNKFIIALLLLPLLTIDSFGLYYVERRATNSQVNESDNFYVKIEKKADFVAMPISLTNNKADAKKRNNNLVESMEIIKKAAKKISDLRIDAGHVSLSGSAKKKGFKSFVWERKSEINFNLLLPLDENIYKVAERLDDFIQGLELSSGVKANPRKLLLVVDDPEKYRKNLLAKVSKELEMYKSSLKSMGKVTLFGLEKPIRVRQIDAPRVQLFLEIIISAEIR